MRELLYKVMARGRKFPVSVVTTAKLKQLFEERAPLSDQCEVERVEWIIQDG